MSNHAPEDSIPSTPSTPAFPGKALLDVPGKVNAFLLLPTHFTNPTPLKPSPPSGAAPLVPKTEKNLEENAVEAEAEHHCSLIRRPWAIFWFAVAAAVVTIVLAVVLPVYFTVIKLKNDAGAGSTNSTGGDHGRNNPGPPNPPSGLTTGGDGSIVTMENGTQFTYRNPFDGFCQFFLSRITGCDLTTDLQGFGIRKTRTMTVLGQIRGRRL